MTNHWVLFFFCVHFDYPLPGCTDLQLQYNLIEVNANCTGTRTFTTDPLSELFGRFYTCVFLFRLALFSLRSLVLLVKSESCF